MIVCIIILIVAAFIVYKIKEEKDYRESKKQEEAEMEKKRQERKKNGEPSVSVELPPGAAAIEETLTGADGKSYPDPKLFASTVVVDNFTEWKTTRYEYSPVYCMLASECYIREFLGDLKKYPEYSPKNVELGMDCIFELAENYAYPVCADDDLAQAGHYTVRRLADRKRAMEGNGYYKNAYDFPIDLKQALKYYELMERIHSDFIDQYSKMNMEHILILARAWLQMGHMYSAGLRGIRQDVEEAKKRYAQAFGMSESFSMDDVSMEVVGALCNGYPRNPEDYAVNVTNMLASWACESDLGLAMYAEYMWHIDELDKERLAKSPQEVVALCRDEAENNHYAAYLLGRALLCGYGTAKNEEQGRRFVELAAEDGCIAALYLMKELDTGDPDQAVKREAKLNSAVAVIAEKCAFMRDALKKAGMDVGNQSLQKVRSEMAEKAEEQARQQYDQELDASIAEMMRQSRDSGGDAFAGSESYSNGFDFPQYIYDGDDNPWELMNSGTDNANYYCQKTGQTAFFYASDFEYGAPDGFHKRII